MIGRDATESAIKRVSAGFDIWHLATHAVLDAAVPERSAVVLGETSDDDGLLQAREIYRLPLRGSLVVLSSCRTADGQISGAEGLIGLSRAFLFAGSRTVIGARWDVPDAATASLVKSFYAQLERGADVDAAMAHAQRAMAGRAPYASSRTWAAFVVSGDGRVRMDPREGTRAPAIAGATALMLLALAGISATQQRRRRPTSR